MKVTCRNEDGVLNDLAVFLDQVLPDLPFFGRLKDVKTGGTHEEVWNPPADLPADVESWLRHEIVDLKECSLIDATVLPRCDDGSEDDDQSQDDEPEDDGSALLPGTCVGAFPTTSYDLTFERSKWDDMDVFADLLGYVMTFTFDVATLIVGAAIWLIGYALTWRVASGVELPASMAQGFHEQVVGPLYLDRIAWLALVAWVAFAVLRGKTAAGAAEFLLSVVLAMLAIVVVNDVTDRNGSYIADTVDVMDRLSAGVLLAGTGEDPRWSEEEVDVATAVEPLQRSLHVAFIDSAYDQLNWGTAVGLTSDDDDTRAARGIHVPKACVEAKEHILRIQDPDPEWAARHMERAGDDCRKLAEFNRRATSERTFASILNLLGALVLVALFGLLAFTLLISKFTLTLIFAATPFAAVAAVFPGVARRGAWVWLGAILQVYVVVIGSAGLLAVLLISVESTLDTVMGVNLVQRWVLVLVVLATMFVLRRRLLAASRVIAGKFADSLTRLSIHNIGFQGGAVGTNLTAPEDLAGRSFMIRRIERRVRRRSLRNLEIMERTRERGTYAYEQKIPLGSGTSDSEPVGGGDGGRELLVTMKMRAPRSPFRHPAGAVADRARLRRNRRELHGIIRRAQKARHRWP